MCSTVRILCCASHVCCSGVIVDDQISKGAGHFILSYTFVGPLILPESQPRTVVVEDETVRVTVHHISANPHGEGMVLTVVEVGGEMYVYQADLYNAGFGFTLVIGGPESLFAILRDLEILDASCASAMPLTIIPAHGTPLSLADSLAELAGLGVDVSCPEWLLSR